MVKKVEKDEIVEELVDKLPLWELGIVELTGHNIESAGREEVNKLLKKGWVLLHIYNLKYRQKREWRERPMAILGRPRKKVGKLLRT